MSKFKLIFLSVLLIVAFLLSGCSTPVQNAPIVEQQSLLQKCTTDTPIPKNFIIDDKGEKVYTGQELYYTLRDWQDVYNKCAANHNKLVDVLNDLKNMKEIPKK